MLYQLSHCPRNAPAGKVVPEVTTGTPKHGAITEGTAYGTPRSDAKPSDRGATVLVGQRSGTPPKSIRWFEGVNSVLTQPPFTRVCPFQPKM
ncbi:hypothetical protein GCM10011314_11790 [Knoellia flava]|uniref:Uncharacterized protein n=1 Tax=Knoellia flava TaxID=913969 RepID=A0A8H9FR31_9MICO|nr:hypothetical protein GCM10011314_11790 [Knoellia flava]